MRNKVLAIVCFGLGLFTQFIIQQDDIAALFYACIFYAIGVFLIRH